MAVPVTSKFGAFSIEIGDGATPTQNFVAPCGFTQKAYKRSKNLNDVIIPDCADPDEPAWVGRDVQSISAEISGEGIMAQDAVPVWDKMFNSTVSRTCKVKINWTSGLITYVGLFHLSEFEITGSLGERLKVSVKLESDGPITRVPVLP